eukprot:GFUD01092631.1.p1 GENE.GFUD01092631.1~~GFUD01092631.1.p1  ORF type:complete len:564 (-),score=152.43 GFUD01092631.1:25-1716(-)
MLLSLLVTTTLVVTQILAQSDYCLISPQHTMCQYEGAGPACNGQPLARGVTKEQIVEILDVHNRYRSLIARGEETRGSPGAQPPAANMKQMVWDNELARIAQRHADQCKFAHDCSSCRKTKRFGVGQNLYIYKQTLAPPKTDWDKAVTDWYEEVTLFSNKNVEPFQFSSPTGHFTQLVWGDTDKVGCGATQYKDGRWFATLYTCNYGPNGNFIRGQMYRQGPACSACSQGGQCSGEFPGLCVSGKSAPFTPVKSLSPVRNTTRTTEQPIKAITTVAKATKRPNRFDFQKTTLRPERTTTVKPTTTTKKTKTTTKKLTTTTIKSKPTTTKQPRKTTIKTITPTTKKQRRTTKKPRTTTSKTISTTTKRPRTTTKQITTTTATLRSTTVKTIKPTASKSRTIPIKANTTSSVVENDLFICKFNDREENCIMKNNGKPWNQKQKLGNKYQEIELFKQEKAEFFFSKRISPPASKVACLDFRFKKFSTAGARHILTVLAWPNRGKPGKVSIVQDSPDQFTWVRAQVTFRNVDRDFLLMFRAKGPQEGEESLTLAVDDVRVTTGRCVQ